MGAQRILNRRIASWCVVLVNRYSLVGFLQMRSGKIAGLNERTYAMLVISYKHLVIQIDSTTLALLIFIFVK